jgi:hypothetical protein
MTQCEHIFELDSSDHQVKCKLCGDLDDEMQLSNPKAEAAEELDDFYKSQVSFE